MKTRLETFKNALITRQSNGLHTVTAKDKNNRIKIIAKDKATGEARRIAVKINSPRALDLKEGKLKHASDNSISEIFAFLSEIEQAKENYKHIEEYFPVSLIHEINKFHKAVSKEHDRRENEM